MFFYCMNWQRRIKSGIIRVSNKHLLRNSFKLDDKYSWQPMKKKFSPLLKLQNCWNWEQGQSTNSFRQRRFLGKKSWTNGDLRSQPWSNGLQMYNLHWRFVFVIKAITGQYQTVDLASSGKNKSSQKTIVLCYNTLIFRFLISTYIIAFHITFCLKINLF